MKPREIIISPVLNGFLVHAGCQRLVFNDAAELGASITRYYTNPGDVEREFLKNKVNDTMGGDCNPVRDPGFPSQPILAGAPRQQSECMVEAEPLRPVERR